MRTLNLSRPGLNKVKSQAKELKTPDVEDSLKSCHPGEWCLLKGSTPDELWAAFLNPLVGDKFASIHVVEKLNSKDAGSFEPEAFILSKVRKAYEARLRFSGYENGSRLFYGASDGLPGLIIDLLDKTAIIQINTAGVDKFRDLIKKTIEDLIKGKAYFLDNAKYREKEFLPTFETEKLPDVTVQENGLQYHLRSEVLQKVGFYYDHRENRLSLLSLLSRLKLKPKKGLDLFSYAGAWGMNALKGGVSFVDFVDQGDFSVEISEGLKVNGFEGKGSFFRKDVFRHLDESIAAKNLYDLILCDPPAFAKSSLQKPQALEGYSKLHRKVLKLAAPGAVCVFSSCTHYVSHEEFQKNILDAASKENRKIQLLHCGMQGFDHPVQSLEERANYIKSYFYILES